MTVRFSAATKVAILLAAVSVVAISLGADAASAQSRREQMKYDRDGRPTYGANGPNRSYQQGPNTRVYITTRSWLDAGTEVLPGDRKFNDYAYPPTTSFGMQNNNRPLARQPLSPPEDLGGYPRNFPLY